jgi:hypothetical protein
MAFITSRRSKVLHVHYPTQPSNPLIVSTIPAANSVSTAAIQYNFNGDQRNIYGFELRCADNYTVVYQRPVASYADLYVDLALNTPLPYVIAPGTYMTLIAYFFSSTWSYSAPTPLNIVVPSVNSSASVVINSATFAIADYNGGPIPGYDDICPHYLCNDSGGTIVTASAQCSTWGSDVVTPLVITVDIGPWDGSVWNNIFLGTLNIPGGSVATETMTAGFSSNSKLSKGDQMRVNLMPTSNVTCRNLTVNVGWSNI